MFDEFEWDYSYFTSFVVMGCGGAYGQPYDPCPAPGGNRKVTVVGETGVNGTMTMSGCCYENYCFQGETVLYSGAESVRISGVVWVVLLATLFYLL